MIRLIAQRIRQKRKAAHLSIEQLAEKAGISTSYLAYIESGNRRPTLETLDKLAVALELPVSDLVKVDARDGQKKLDDAVAMRSFARLIRGESRKNVADILSLVEQILKFRRK